MNTPQREIEISEEKSKTIETLSKDITSLKEKIRELEGRIEKARTTATEWAKTMTGEHDKNVDLRKHVAILRKALKDLYDIVRVDGLIPADVSYMELIVEALEKTK